MPDEAGSEQAHEAGEADQFDAGGFEPVGHRGVETGPVREGAVIDGAGGKAVLPRPVEAGSAGSLDSTSAISAG